MSFVGRRCRPHRESENLMYVELDYDAAELAAEFGCTVERIGYQPSYQISGSCEQLEALLADGGYDPDTEIHEND